VVQNVEEILTLLKVQDMIIEIKGIIINNLFL
jgi:hypothetical protein